MNYKKLIVTEDNKLNLEEFNLTPDNAEILDINKSLKDVCEDKELQAFIRTNAVSNQKIYFICLKEDFGSHEQIVENILNVNHYYKQIKKIFKAENIFFFIYNTYMKDNVSINPSLNTPSKLNSQPAIATDVVGVPLDQDKIKSNSSSLFGWKQRKEEKNKIAAEMNQQESKENLSNKNEMSDIDLEREIDNFSSSWNKNNQNSKLSQHIESMSDNYDDPKTEELVQNSYDDLFTFNPNDEDVKKSYDGVNDDIDSVLTSENSLDVPTQPLEDVIEEYRDKNTLENDWNKLDTSELYSNTQTESKEEQYNSKDNTYSGSDMVDIPESFYDSDDLDVDLLNDEESNDYLDFKNDYELNVHALKSIYDFIWRMLILNNYNLKLNDLLYLTVNNLAAFSIGQSDFVRQISNKSDSLFDLVLQLDIKLEFNNSLFYIYLAELFSIKANKIVVNISFLNTLAIWVNKMSKIKFVEQIEQFVNYSAIYNKKIIFSHFVELSNFIKGCLLSIKPTMPLLDVHRIIFNKFKKIRSDNIFGFILDKIHEIFDRVGINIESEIFETPDKMFDGSSEMIDDSSWKEKLIDLYKRLLINIRNYILSKGNNEIEIFNIYIDIKDLKMYFDENAKDLLILKSEYRYSSPTNDKYLTIGDAFDRSTSNVPNASYRDALEMDQENFFKKLESESKLSNETRSKDFYKSATENLPKMSEFINQTREDDESDELNEIDDNLNESNLNQFNKQESNQTTLSNDAPPSYVPNILPQQEMVNKAINNTHLSDDTKFKFVNNGLEDMMSRKIDEYERKIKDNIERIEIERQQLKLKMEELKNL